MMDGRVWDEFSPGRPCVQGGHGVPLRLWGVPLVVSAVGDVDVGGRQFAHLGGVGEVAGDDDLGVIGFAVDSEGDDVVGRCFVLGGFFRRVQFECRIGFGTGGLCWDFACGPTLVLDQILWA